MSIILGNFLISLSRVVDIVLTITYWLILFRAILSWVSPDPFNPIVQSLYRLTEPILEPLRRLIPPRGLDFSPIIAFLIIIFLQSFLVATLRDTGYHMRQSKQGQVQGIMPY